MRGTTEQAAKSVRQASPTNPRREFRRCDNCRSERTCYEYEGVWLCNGPNKCYRNRKSLSKRNAGKRVKR